jgi:DHA1 family tetracycline resistance protein-like MFS transporter
MDPAETGTASDTRRGWLLAIDARLVVVALVLFVNALGSGLILPLLPFFAIHLGASPIVIGLLIATLPLFATLSGPPLGALSDRYGRKPILVLSVAGTLAGFLLLGVAQTLPLVFLARIVDGASAGNTATARAAIADITSRQARAAGIGVAFAMESLGLVLGPVLGGVFAQYGLGTSAFVAAGIAAVCLLLAAFAFPETRAAARVSTSPRGTFGLGAVGAVARTPLVRTLVLVIFAVQLLIMMMWGTLALYANDLFGFGGTEMGYVSAFAAATGILAQAGLLRLLLRITADTVILLGALLSMAVGLLLLAASGGPLMLLGGVGLLAASFNVAMPTAMSFVSRVSSEDEQGGVIGLASGAINLAAVLGPIVAGGLFAISARGSYAAAAVLALAMLALATRGVSRLTPTE